MGIHTILIPVCPITHAHTRVTYLNSTHSPGSPCSEGHHPRIMADRGVDLWHGSLCWPITCSFRMHPDARTPRLGLGVNLDILAPRHPDTFENSK